MISKAAVVAGLAALACAHPHHADIVNDVTAIPGAVQGNTGAVPPSASVKPRMTYSDDGNDVNEIDAAAMAFTTLTMTRPASTETVMVTYTEGKDLGFTFPRFLISHVTTPHQPRLLAMASCRQHIHPSPWHVLSMYCTPSLPALRPSAILTATPSIILSRSPSPTCLLI